MTGEKPRFEPIPWMGKRDINRVIREDVPENVSMAVLSAALNSGDGIWAEKVCYKLVNHLDPNVRGNALLSIGHIARVHGTLDRKRALSTLKAALNDDHEFVRAHADDALDDVRHFMKRDGRWPVVNRSYCEKPRERG